MLRKKYISKGSLLLLALVMSSFTTNCFRKKQGIKGTVFLVSGNQMPSPDLPPPTPKPFATTLYLYKKTNLQQVERQDNSAFYTAIHTEFIKEIRTDTRGRFKIRLEPGEYSVFSKKGNLFYANTFDQYNTIAPVKVVAGKFKEITIKVDYDAVY
jgi:hypothetical protein